MNSSCMESTNLAPPNVSISDDIELQRTPPAKILVDKKTCFVNQFSIKKLQLN